MNSSYNDPLNHEYHWYEMILKCFDTQTDRQNPEFFFIIEYNKRLDVYTINEYFYKKCKEYTLKLKDAYEDLLKSQEDKFTITNDSAYSILKNNKHFFKYNHFPPERIIIFTKEEPFKKILNALEKLIQSGKTSTPDKVSEINQKVKDAFSFTLKIDPRKHKQILSDEDYDKLVGWVTYFFENNFEVPSVEFPIETVNSSKGNIIYTFKKLFNDLFPNSTSPDSFFELISTCFSKYKNYSKQNIQKMSKPQYYDQQVINISKT